MHCDIMIRLELYGFVVKFQFLYGIVPFFFKSIDKIELLWYNNLRIMMSYAVIE